MSLKSRIIFLLFFLFFFTFSVSKIAATTGQTGPSYVGQTNPTSRPTSCPSPNGRLSINSSMCFANILLKCSNTGILGYTVCTYGCSGNACKEKTAPPTKLNSCSTPNGPVATNSSTCFENTLYKCSNVATLSYTNCVYGCSNNACRGKNDPKPTMCSAPYGNIALNTSACMANTVYKCSSAGTLTSTTCPYGCTSNYCNGKPAPTPTPLPTPTPTPIPAGCSSPGGQLSINTSRCFYSAIFRCTSNGTLAVTSCPNGCLSDSSCMSEPTPTPSSCSLKGGMCRPDFTCMGNYYITGDHCALFSCCAPRPTPTPQPTYCPAPGGSLPIGASTCFDNAIFRCQSNGSLSVTSCPYGCNGSSCITQPNHCSYPGGTLSLGSSSCYSGTLFMCQGNGSLSTISCQYGCSGNYCNTHSSYCSYPGGTLSPGSSGCYSTTLYSCSSSGSLYTSSCPYGCAGSYCKSATY